MTEPTKREAERVESRARHRRLLAAAATAMPKWNLTVPHQKPDPEAEDVTRRAVDHLLDAGLEDAIEAVIAARASITVRAALNKVDLYEDDIHARAFGSLDEVAPEATLDDHTDATVAFLALATLADRYSDDLKP